MQIGNTLLMIWSQNSCKQPIENIQEPSSNCKHEIHLLATSNFLQSKKTGFCFWFLFFETGITVPLAGLQLNKTSFLPLLPKCQDTDMCHYLAVSSFQEFLCVLGIKPGCVLARQTFTEPQPQPYTVIRLLLIIWFNYSSSLILTKLLIKFPQ